MSAGLGPFYLKFTAEVRMNSGTYSNAWYQTFLLLPRRANTALPIPEAACHLVALMGRGEVKNIMNLLLYDIKIII